MKNAMYNIYNIRLNEHLEIFENELKYIKWDIQGGGDSRLLGNR